MWKQKRSELNSNVIVNRERVKPILGIDLYDLLSNVYCIKRVREQESLYYFYSISILFLTLGRRCTQVAEVQVLKAQVLMDQR